MITSWTHPQSRDVITREAIERLVEAYQTAPRERQRRMAWDQLHRIGVQLHEIVQHLERKLERGDELLTGAYDAAREDRWLEWTARYESACDALSLIRWRVAENRPELVSERRETGYERSAA
jgi:hypothetical protein